MSSSSRVSFTVIPSDFPPKGSTSDYYFYIKEYIYEVETDNEVETDRLGFRYINAVKLGLLTDDQADIVFEKAVRPFVDRIGNIKTKTEYAITNLWRSLGVTKSEFSEEVAKYLKKFYDPRDEVEIDDAIFLEWKIMSESFIRCRYQNALQQHYQTGFDKPTNDTIMAAAVHVAELIQQKKTTAEYIVAPLSPTKRGLLLADRDAYTDDDTNNVAPSATPKSVQHVAKLIQQKHCATKTPSVDPTDKTNENTTSPPPKPSSKRPRSRTNTQKHEPKYESIVEGFLNLSIDEVVTGKAKRLITKNEMASEIKKMPAFQDAKLAAIEKGVGRTPAWKNRKKQLEEAQRGARLGQLYIGRKKANAPFREVQ